MYVFYSGKLTHFIWCIRKKKIEVVKQFSSKIITYFKTTFLWYVQSYLRFVLPNISSRKMVHDIISNFLSLSLSRSLPLFCSCSLRLSTSSCWWDVSTPTNFIHFYSIKTQTMVHIYNHNLKMLYRLLCQHSPVVWCCCVKTHITHSFYSIHI